LLTRSKKDNLKANSSVRLTSQGGVQCRHDPWLVYSNPCIAIPGGAAYSNQMQARRGLEKTDRQIIIII